MKKLFAELSPEELRDLEAALKKVGKRADALMVRAEKLQDLFWHAAPEDEIFASRLRFQADNPTSRGCYPFGRAEALGGAG